MERSEESRGGKAYGDEILRLRLRMTAAVAAFQLLRHSERVERSEESRNTKSLLVEILRLYPYGRGIAPAPPLDKMSCHSEPAHKS